VRDRGHVHVGRVRDVLLEPALVAKLPDRSPRRFLRFVATTHAMTLASA
jgi:hypothetical protein